MCYLISSQLEWFRDERLLTFDIKPSDFELYLSSTVTSVNHVPRVHKCDIYMYFKVDVKSKQPLEHNS